MTYEYDVALSFAGEDRSYVEQVADCLRRAGVRVFYDQYETVTLWGKDLYEHLDEVYRKKARFCVMFISQAYRDKLWTSHERLSAQARAFEERQEYILPARFDETEIPGVRPTVGYVDLRRLEPKDLSALVLEKLGSFGPNTSTTDVKSVKPRQYRRPRVARKSFNPYDETLTFMSSLTNDLKLRCDELAEAGITASVFDREGRKCLRVVKNGATVYSLDISMGGPGRDSSLRFHGGRGELRSASNSYNAWGNIVWDSDADLPALAFSDFSLLGYQSEERTFRLTDFTDAIWNAICDAIENST